MRTEVITQVEEVSIRAHHCWWANRVSHQPADATFEFQSAPTIAGGRITAMPDYVLVLTKFQSAPTIAGGRILARQFGVHERSIVSIRAHHCWWANP